MDIANGWLVKLVVAQVLYLIAFVWGMRALNRWRLARVRVSRPTPMQTSVLSASRASVPFQKL